MPPHCDSLDGPVVTAARQALEAEEPAIVLPYVPKDGEEEGPRGFDAVLAIRGMDPAVRDLADRHFFETVVRIHRAGEGAPFTGLKPAGVDHGPVIPVAERTLETGSPDELVALLTERLAEEVRDRLRHAMELKGLTNGELEANRAYVEAMLDLQVWSHRLFEAIGAGAHEHQHTHAG